VRQPNRFHASGSAVSDVLGGIAYAALGLLTVWGIGWSFYRDGPGAAAVAFFMPPYAWYRGVAAAWDKPRWMEDYNARTEQIGILIENAVNRDPSYQLQSRDFVRDLRGWLQTLPRTQHEQLKEASRNYANTIAEFVHAYLSARLAGTTNPHPELEPRIQERIEKFKGVTGLAARWGQFVQDTGTLKDVIPAEEDSLRTGQIEPDPRDLAVTQNRLRNAIDEMSAKMERTVDELFDSK
jgi:hypothetical protein